MTNDEVPNDEGMTKPGKVLPHLSVILFVIGPFLNVVSVYSSLLSTFGLRHSFVIGCLVIRHLPAAPQRPPHIGAVGRQGGQKADERGENHQSGDEQAFLPIELPEFEDDARMSLDHRCH